MDTSDEMRQALGEMKAQLGRDGAWKRCTTLRARRAYAQKMSIQWEREHQVSIPPSAVADLVELMWLEYEYRTKKREK